MSLYGGSAVIQIKEVSMNIRIGLENRVRKAVLARLKQAYATGALRLIKRIHALLQLAAGQTVTEVADELALGEQTVRDYVRTFLLNGVDSLVYHRPSGRPAKLTKTQRKELATLIEAGPEAAGYDCGCWSAVLIQDLIYRRFGREYNPHYVSELLHQLGFSFQKGRFVSDHLNEAQRQEWLQTAWPRILHYARRRQALLLFGDEASFAQWGSLSYTWARKGQQPLVKTSGKRKGYKVFGLIDYFSGRLFYKGHTGRFTSTSYQAFLREVLAQTQQHLVLIQDGARYHTSADMLHFFEQHQDRLTVYQLPAYSPDFNPIEYLWRKVKKQATHLRYFPTFEELTQKVEAKLLHFAKTPAEILSLMGKYCGSLGTVAA
jgi:transposase